MTVQTLDPATDLGLTPNQINTVNSNPSDLASSQVHQVPPMLEETPVFQEPVMKPAVNAVNTQYSPLPMEESGGSNILFILSIILFCASLGVVIYFGLQYFSVI